MEACTKPNQMAVIRFRNNLISELLSDNDHRPKPTPVKLLKIDRVEVNFNYFCI